MTPTAPCEKEHYRCRSLKARRRTYAMPGAGYVKPTIAAAVRDGLNKMTEFFNPVAKSGRKAKKRAAPKPSKGTGTTAPAATGTASTAQPGGAPPKKRHKHKNWATAENQAKLRQALSDWEAKTGACSTDIDELRIALRGE